MEMLNEAQQWMTEYINVEMSDGKTWLESDKTDDQFDQL